MSIVHLTEPTQPAGTLNVLDCQPGQRLPYGIAMLEGSYGDWTLYLSRELGGANATVPSRVEVDITVGHDRAAAKANVYTPVFLTAQSLRTWLVYHVVGSQLICNLTASYLAGAKPTLDRVNGWIAPGRPAHTPVTHFLIALIANPIPTFATHLEIDKDVIAPSTLDWTDAQGNVTTTVVTLSATGEVVNRKIPIPNGARTVTPHVTGVDTDDNLPATWWVYA